jgi:hypothetical protein
MCEWSEVSWFVSDWVSQLVESCCKGGGGEFGNPEEGERPPIETATKQRVVKTEETLCVL